jgi:hypothetical protein
MNKYRICFLFITLLVIIPVMAGIGIGQSTTQTETNASIIDLDTEEVNIQLQAQQLTVEHDEPIILMLSTASYVTNSESATVQLIVESSSGVSITGSTAEQGSGSQFSTVTTIDPGSSESIRVVISPNEPGTYQITTEVVYYVGNNPNSGSGERTSISITQNPPPRDLFWWTPTIVGFISGGVITAWLLQPPNADRVRKWGDHEPFMSALVVVGVGSISVCLAGTWFSQYIRSTNATPFEIGFGLSFVTAIIGLVLTVVASMGQFTDKVRLGYAFLSVLCTLAVPIQIGISLLLPFL